jgi:hypothetical protein
MKLPSLESLYKEASVTFSRFPFVLLSSFLGAAIMIYAIEVDYLGEMNYQYLYNGVLACVLGISLFLSVTLHGEMNGWGKPAIYAVQGMMALVLIGYYFSLPEELTQTDIIRFLLFALTLHLLVSLAPYILRKEINGFWHYNEIFFIRFLTAALYSGVLFGGLAIAIVSFDQLFDMDINDRRYPQLFFFIAGVFNTWFFLAGVPASLEKLNESIFYPKGLKLFTQYVLLPLVTVYLIILYLYTGKILLQWEWPVGWVSNLVLGFSITGIFSILLIYPVRNLEGNKWINTFSRLFYLALFPLIILLFFAILRRIDEYGITENRYFVLLLALWLAGIALYFTFSREKNIKIIPATLCIIAFLSSFGPWGAFSVSINSQVNRLENILVSNNILVDGKVVKAQKQPEGDAGFQVRSILDYLQERKALDEIEGWFSKDIMADIPADEKYYLANKMMDEMGLEEAVFSTNYSWTNLSFTSKEGASFDIKDYDQLYSISTSSFTIDSLKNEEQPEKNEPNTKASFNIDSTVISVMLDKERQGLLVLRNNKDELFIEIMKALKSRDIKTAYDVDPALLTMEAENAALKVKLIIKNLTGERLEGKEEVQSLHGILLVKLK